jgi:hypothetical protein
MGLEWGGGQRFRMGGGGGGDRGLAREELGWGRRLIVG